MKSQLALSSIGAWPRPRALQNQRPQLLTDIVMDNARLRAALVLSRGAGVHRDLVNTELRHRVGNLLAVVQAIARKTFETADAAKVTEFNARLQALAGAQKLLIDAETRPTLLAEVIRLTLAPHGGLGDRLRAVGPDVHLDGRRAHALTLALHELATNAAKYGALSVSGGGIDITWRLQNDMLDFIWREHDGPPVALPTRRGFGSSLITNNLGAAFFGEAALTFPPGGVEYRLLAPMKPRARATTP